MKIYFSTNLKTLLMSHRLSQTELANRLGMKPQNVSKYLSGDNFPSIQNLALIAEIFGVTIDDLVRADLDNPIKVKDPAPEYQKIENVGKLIEAFEAFTDELKQIKQPNP